MSTPYENVYNRFLIKVKDYKMANLSLEVVEERMLDYLKSAIAKFTECRSDLTKRNDVFGQFTVTLSELEEELLSMYMVISWLEPNINDILLLQPILNDRDFNLFSQANNLKSKLALKTNIQDNIDGLTVKYNSKYAKYDSLG